MNGQGGSERSTVGTSERRNVPTAPRVSLYASPTPSPLSYIYVQVRALWPFSMIARRCREISALRHPGRNGRNVPTFRPFQPLSEDHYERHLIMINSLTVDPRWKAVE